MLIDIWSYFMLICQKTPSSSWIQFWGVSQPHHRSCSPPGPEWSSGNYSLASLSEAWRAPCISVRNSPMVSDRQMKSAIVILYIHIAHANMRQWYVANHLLTNESCSGIVMIPIPTSLLQSPSKFFTFEERKSISAVKTSTWRGSILLTACKEQ